MTGNPPAPIAARASRVCTAAAAACDASLGLTSARPRRHAAHRDVQAGQITATPTPLPGALLAGRLAGHKPGRAIPQALVLDELADRLRDNPPGPGEMTKHRVLIRQVRRGSPGVIAPEHHPPSGKPLHQPVGVLAGNVPENGNPVSAQAQPLKHAGR